jgi:hypothetical protein
MNPHERAFVENFIDSRRRERFLEALASPKGRKVFHRELCHPHFSNFLLSKYVGRVAPSEQDARSIAGRLEGMGAPDLCWVFGNNIDSQAMKLEEALVSLVGWQTGTIVSCLPGELAYLESEDGRFILRKV